MSALPAAATKSTVLGILILVTARFFVDYEIAHPLWMVGFLVLLLLVQPGQLVQRLHVVGRDRPGRPGADDDRVVASCIVDEYVGRAGVALCINGHDRRDA